LARQTPVTAGSADRLGETEAERDDRNLIAGWCSVSTGRSAWSRTPTWWPSWVSQRWPGGLGGRAARGQLCVQGSADHDHHDRHRLPFRRAWFCLPLIRRQSRFPSWSLSLMPGAEARRTWNRASRSRYRQ